MDDLNGLDWSTPSVTTNRGYAGAANYFTSLRANIETHSSGKNVTISDKMPSINKSFPSSNPMLSSHAKLKPADSFSNLVSFGSLKETPNLTLREQQEKLESERKRLETEKKKLYDLQFGSSGCWDELGNNRSGQTNTSHFTSNMKSSLLQSSLAPRERPHSPPAVNSSAVIGSGADIDLFAAFNAETKVDVSSHYPPPQRPGSETRKSLDLSRPQDWEISGNSFRTDFDDYDDPFDLKQLNPGLSVPTERTKNMIDEDFLGDLGRPIEEVRKENIPNEMTVSRHDSKPKENDLRCKAIAELVEMGFTAEKSQLALTETGPGLNIQSAVSWILNDSQIQSQKSYLNNKSGGPGKLSEHFYSDQYPENNITQRKNDEKKLSNGPKDLTRSFNGDVDLSKTVSAVGNNLVKSANSLWKISQKKVQKVVADFQQQDSKIGPHHPKWMQENSHRDYTREIPIIKDRASDHEFSGITDEALMLERRSRSTPNKVRANQIRDFKQGSSCDQPALSNKALSVSGDPKSLWKNSVSEVKRTNSPSDDKFYEQAYISPAQRRRVTPKVVSIEKDLNKSMKKSFDSLDSSLTAKPLTSAIHRPRASTHHLPHISLADLQLSTQHRIAGTSHFKRGDYISAHSSYTSSISALPESHPINIVLLCNRALTSLRNGTPKFAVQDTDRALSLIGESHGDGEIIDLGPGEGGGIRDMKDFYNKAMMRKAEALEQMERWEDAWEIWRVCVEQGVRGSLAIEGRTRCEKMLNRKSLSASVQNSVPQNKYKPSTSTLNTSTMNSENSPAVKKLREANEKAEIADNEKLALIDKVEDQIALWRDGKRDNLRALIGSLDGIMWQGSGWKKVGMHELVQNNRVKINYMKAIGKTHPDKLPQDASMEVRMIAALVFATLNESWDKFKQQNGM